MYSVKVTYLVFAITVHLLLFLFECYGNKEDVRALAYVRACIRTCACDLSSKREHQFKDFGRSRSLGIETHTHSHTIWTRNLRGPKIPHLHQCQSSKKNMYPMRNGSLR